MSTHSATDMHQPSETFRDYLEGEVTRTYRRGRTLRRLRSVAVVLVSIGIGTTATLASAQVREGAQRSALLEAARADAMLASIRLTLAQATLAQEQQQVAVGARMSGSLGAAELQLKELEALMGRIALNIEEIEATSLPPRNELNAPLVNGKDFVTKRLELQLMVAQKQLESAEQMREEIARRIRVGATTELEIAEPELALARARRDFAVMAERIGARREFLGKGTSMQQLTRRLERAELMQEMDVAQRTMKLAQERVALLERRKQVGAIGELEILRAQVELKEREIEVQQLARRLKEIGRPE